VLVVSHHPRAVSSRTMEFFAAPATPHW
jgi:hypothetical protein